MRCRHLSFALALVFLAFPAWGAEKLSGYKVVYEMTIEGSENPTKGPATSYLVDGKMRTEVNTSMMGPTVVLKTGNASGASYMLLPDQKIYYDLEKLPFGAPDVSEEAAKANYEKTDRTKKIAGYSCRVYTAKIRGGIQEICATTELKGLYQKIMNSDVLPQEFGSTDYLKKLGGYPLEIIQYEGDKKAVQTKIQVKSVEEGKYVATLFQVPEGYQESEPPGMNMQDRMREMKDVPEGFGRTPGDEKDIQDMMQRMKEKLLKQKP